jgi:hypothetical protein
MTGGSLVMRGLVSVDRIGLEVFGGRNGPNFA